MWVHIASAKQTRKNKKKEEMTEDDRMKKDYFHAYDTSKTIGRVILDFVKLLVHLSNGNRR